MAGKIIASVGELKKGKYVLIDEVPCRVVDVTKSKPGKHGAAKARVNAIGIFSGQKKQLLKPVDANCEVPIVDKRKGQMLSDMGDKVQIMDLETYETYELAKPEGFTFEAGKEIPYTEVMGVRAII